MQEKRVTVEVDEGMASTLGVQTSMIYTKVGRMNEEGKEPTAEDVRSMFPFLTINQVKHSLRTLEREGAIKSDQPLADILIMTKTYRVVDHG